MGEKGRELLRSFDPIVYFHALWSCLSGAALVGLSGAATLILAWDKLSTPERAVGLIGVATAVIKSLDMLFNNVMSRLVAGKLPVKLEGQNGFDTTHLEKPKQ